MMKKVIWTPTARRSLQQTVNFISERWNAKVVNTFLDELDYRIAQVQRNPGLDPALIDSEFRQLLIQTNVTVFYKDQPKCIKILLVWDNRQDPSILFEKLTAANNNE